MSNVASILDESINVNGLSDIVTIMLSQVRDIEVVREQEKIYEEYKKRRLSI